MTQSKIDLKMGELVRQHGDIEVVVYRDGQGNRLGGYRLSDVPVRNTADYKEILRILKNGAPRYITVHIKK